MYVFCCHWRTADRFCAFASLLLSIAYLQAMAQPQISAPQSGYRNVSCWSYQHFNGLTHNDERCIQQIKGTSFCWLSPDNTYCDSGEPFRTPGVCTNGQCILLRNDGSPILNQTPAVTKWILIVVLGGLGGAVAISLIIFLVWKGVKVSIQRSKPHEETYSAPDASATDLRHIPLQESHCAICHLRLLQCVVVPCGHTFCVTCVERRERCPSCRIDIRSLVKLTGAAESDPAEPSRFICSKCNMEMDPVTEADSSVLAPCCHLLCSNCTDSLANEITQCHSCRRDVDSIVPIVWNTVVVQPVSPLPLIPHKAIQIIKRLN